MNSSWHQISMQILHWKKTTCQANIENEEDSKLEWNALITWKLFCKFCSWLTMSWCNHKRGAEISARGYFQINHHLKFKMEKKTYLDTKCVTFLPFCLPTHSFNNHLAYFEQIYLTFGFHNLFFLLAHFIDFRQHHKSLRFLNAIKSFENFLIFFQNSSLLPQSISEYVNTFQLSLDILSLWWTFFFLTDQ